MFSWLRRAYQAVFLAFFLFLVFVSTSQYIRGYDVQWFLELDPLVALTTTLASHALHHTLLWALPLIVLTLVFGRFFCSWICPMGTLHHMLGFLGRKRKVLDRVKQNAPRPSHKIKYAILAVMLGLAAAGSTQIGLLDPIASTWRGLSVSLLPAASNTAYGLYQGERHFQWGTFVTIYFLAALALNFVYPRFYCRVLCPLGALLGLLSKFALFRIAKEPGKCNDCEVCGADCQGAADPQGKVRATECMVCLNCIQGCKRGGLAYRFLPELRLSKTTTDLSRRKWITAGVAGVVSVPLARASDGVDPRPNPARIRPPGALEESEFLAKCLKCGACMKVCPTGGLQPALHEAGIEGLWTPILVPRIGYCEHSCTLCGQVCPTGAIAQLKLADKVGNMPDKPPVRIGSAFFDKGRCLPWGYNIECIVCEEVCPTSPKAIYFKLETVTDRNGQEKTLKFPHVDLDHCTGCGICETRCPVVDRAGIRVSAANESRTSRSSISLSGGKI
ncbi:MAG: 4Fe-4S binding protein [Deltaproteobacteria bacterium]|nr:4Fe-4S binding protein [Deltaproteobacteria bacterium]